MTDRTDVNDLGECRAAIEAIDRGIIELLRDRLALAKRSGELKHAKGLPVLDPQREAQVIRNAVANARDAGLDDESVRGIFWHILGMSRRAQQPEKG